MWSVGHSLLKPWTEVAAEVERNKKYRNIVLIASMGWRWGVRVKKEHRRTGAAGTIAMLLMKWRRLGEGRA